MDMRDVSFGDGATKTHGDQDFLRREIFRVGATESEVASALAFMTQEAPRAPRAYDRLSPRLRRLVDLLAVADHDTFEVFALSCAACRPPDYLADDAA
jgi:hypothetical protein